MTFVLDASCALSWCFPDERSVESEALLDRAASAAVVVPGHWHIEVVNGVLTGVRQKRLNHRQIDDYFAFLRTLDIEVELPDFSHDRVVRQRSFATAGALSAYDAAYLEIAERRGLPLGTNDRRLAVAAAARSVEILPR